MGNGSLLIPAVNAVAFILCVTFIAYILMILIPFLRRRPVAPGDPSSLEWHAIVPCLNEALVLDDSIRRLLRDHDRVHVWCVDDGSTDDTPAILARLATESGRVHVVTRVPPDAQQGKGPALNAAWAALDAWLRPSVDRHRVIVGVIDADGWLDPNCLSMISGPTMFGDPAVSAVQIEVRVAGYEDPGGPPARFRRMLVRLQDMEFRTVIAAMQMLRRRLGSVGMGGNGQFTRLSVLDEIAADHSTPWHAALIEDFELGLHVLLVGGKNEYCHDTWVEQQGLPMVRRLIRQRSRWAQGSMQCMRYLGKVLRSPKIATGGAIEVSYFLFLPWVQLFGGVLYAICALALVSYALVAPGGPGGWLAAGNWGFVPLFVVFGLGPIMVWGPVYRQATDRSIGRFQAVMLGLAHWPYTLVHHAASWWAVARIVGARHDWKKTPRIVHQSLTVLWNVPRRSIGGALRLGAQPPTTSTDGTPRRRLVLTGHFRPGRSALSDSHTTTWRNDEPQAA